ncbi:MAG: 3-phosphoshikimate 1-carboxyvinyltransferase, partial [Gammaproteobacteria bacterium]|nr:3-phosphoshikimate 1-carboxyvinyltransferase [Gammaproteobacteria bacterium]
SVPGDLSSAAFFLVGTSITPQSRIVLPSVGLNPTRSGVISVLREMGASITVANERVDAGEPVADLEVRHAPLHGVAIGKRQVALTIDELPILAIAAACAHGTTVVAGAEELRVKESDRIAATVSGLRALGVTVEERRDGMVIEGGGGLDGGTIDSYGDHRIAMAFAIAGLAARESITVRDCANVATSFPDFPELARRAGLRITVRDVE